MNLEDLYRLLRSEHVQAQGIVDTLEEPLLVLDQTGCVLTANRGFYETFSVSRDDTVGRSLFDLGDGQWDIPELRRLVSDIIPKSAAIVGYEVEAEFPTIGRRTMLVSARRLVHPDNNSTSILILFEDVTDRRRSEAQKDILLAEAAPSDEEASRDRALPGLSDGCRRPVSQGVPGRLFGALPSGG
ncbi:PAS domain-containing protein [Bradyrhizobium neotropicale]|uniref:PAS domain-containing protein n=1 Tax=Bradyrhizobium neotropicale TaxID=1497615 RepID=UPI0028A0C2AA|nr:PAS domain-containing protein [Bradyrhizobium neotropicale]